MLLDTSLVSVKGETWNTQWNAGSIDQYFTVQFNKAEVASDATASDLLFIAPYDLELTEAKIAFGASVDVDASNYFTLTVANLTSAETLTGFTNATTSVGWSQAVDLTLTGTDLDAGDVVGIGKANEGAGATLVQPPYVLVLSFKKR